MLNIKDLCKKYNDTNVLNHINISIENNETIAIIGESGSGKTTLAKLIAGLETVSSGSILFNGIDIAKLKKRDFDLRRKIQYIFQDPYSALENQFTIKSTLNETINICKRNGYQCSSVNDILYFVDPNLLNYLNKKVSILSGGQRQKLCIARALLTNPEILIIDEGTSMLDKSSSSEIYNLLYKINREEKITVISILHEIDFKNDNWDKVAVFCKGDLIEFSNFANFTKTCTHPYSKELISAYRYIKNKGDL